LINNIDLKQEMNQPIFPFTEMAFVPKSCFYQQYVKKNDVQYVKN